LAFVTGGIFITVQLTQSKIENLESKFCQHEKKQYSKFEQLAILNSEFRYIREDIFEIKSDIKELKNILIKDTKHNLALNNIQD